MIFSVAAFCTGRRMFRPRWWQRLALGDLFRVERFSVSRRLLVSGIGFEQTEPFVEVAGLSQRVCVLIGWAWPTMLALRLLREERRRAFSPV
jgi:hypothetical protein